MDLTLKSFSLLLSYPTTELQEAVGKIREVVSGDRRLGRREFGRIDRLLSVMQTSDVWVLQEQFVDLFDRSRSLSLNLFEHVHGESRDRGSAMVSLLESYRTAGFEPSTKELPDHLPVLLEYLAMRPASEARDVLADAAYIFEALARRLSRRSSPYASVFSALVSLSGQSVSRKMVADLIAAPDPDGNDLEALDRAWEESEVTFGPDPNAGCPEVRNILSRMDPPAKPGSRGSGPSPEDLNNA